MLPFFHFADITTIILTSDETLIESHLLFTMMWMSALLN